MRKGISRGHKIDCGRHDFGQICVIGRRHHSALKISAATEISGSEIENICEDLIESRTSSLGKEVLIFSMPSFAKFEEINEFP